MELLYNIAEWVSASQLPQQECQATIGRRRKKMEHLNRAWKPGLKTQKINCSRWLQRLASESIHFNSSRQDVHTCHSRLYSVTGKLVHRNCPVAEHSLCVTKWPTANHKKSSNKEERRKRRSKVAWGQLSTKLSALNYEWMSKSEWVSEQASKWASEYKSKCPGVRVRECVNMNERAVYGCWGSHLQTVTCLSPPLLMFECEIHSLGHVRLVSSIPVVSAPQPKGPMTQWAVHYFTC